MSGDNAAIAAVATEAVPRDLAASVAATGNAVAATASSLRSPLAACNQPHSKPPVTSNASTATTMQAHDACTETAVATALTSTSAPISPANTSKRRTTSFQGRLPLRTPATNAAKSAVASALASVSSATTERFAAFRSRSTDTLRKKKSRMPPTATAAQPSQSTTQPSQSTAQPILQRTGSWKMNVNGLARRAKEAARRAASGSRSSTYSWDHHSDANAPQCVTRTFEYHGEDAGAASAYYHIVADGVSSPFGRNSLALQSLREPVSSELIATKLVHAVAQALCDISNDNQSQIDAATFEAAVVNAIQATRIALFMHRQSRIASTLAVAYFDKWRGRLLTFSLGDSKTIVIRDNAVVFETAAVLRDFNMPTVVNLSKAIDTREYVIETFQLQKQDMCMTFSDGIGDNLYVDDIVQAVQDVTIKAVEPVQPLSDSSSSSSDTDSSTDSLDATVSDGPPTTGALSLDALQQLCDTLVQQSQLTISNDRLQSASVAYLNEAAEAPVRGLFPFATAAALEYRKRALAECLSLASSDTTVSNGQHDHHHHHLTHSRALYERHNTKQILSRETLVPRPATRKRHYALAQLQRMAEMQTQKPDDVTLFITQFR